MRPPYCHQVRRVVLGCPTLSAAIHVVGEIGTTVRCDAIVGRGSTGGRPPAFDAALYKARNVVERCSNRLKQFRGLATRFAKRAAYHRAEIILACIVLHLR